MLDVLRRSAAGWVAKILIGLLVLSFAVWGIADIFTGIGQRVVVKVGDAEISPQAFQIAYNRELQALGRRIGRPMTSQEARAFGLQNQVISRLAAEAALNNQANNFGLGISEERLARQITEDDTFKNALGKFDRGRFTQLLRSIGVSEDDFVSDFRDLTLRVQISDALVGDMSAPNTLLELAHQYQNEQRKISYILAGPPNIEAVTEPEDSALLTYFNENKAKFRAPEYRKIEYLKLEPSDIATADSITDDEAKADYEARKTAFTIAERRAVRQMLFKTKDEAQAASDKIKAGSTFDQIAEERGADAGVTDLGTKSQAEFIDKAVATEAFALDSGAVSGVVDGRFGPLLVSVTEIVPETVQPFDEVVDKIKETLATVRGEEKLFTLHDTIEESRAGGSQLSEIAKEVKIELVTVDGVDGQSKDMAGATVALPEARNLLNAVFESDVGIDNEPIQVGRTGFAWYNVTEIVPARDRTLDEVRADVVAAWQDAEIEKRVDALADTILQRVESGESMDAIATDLGLTVSASEGFTRANPTDPLSAAAAEGAFGGPTGHRGKAPAADPKQRIVFEVTDVSIPAFFEEAEEISRIRDAIGPAMQNGLMTNYVTNLQEQFGVQVNQVLLQQITGGGSGS